jgi:hypothetical protein
MTKRRRSRKQPHTESAMTKWAAERSVHAEVRGLGNAGVRGHSVEFSVIAWHGLPGLPDSILNKGRISRGDVLDIGEQVRAEKLSPLALLATSFAWATG